MKVPADVYRPSDRAMPKALTPYDYGDGIEVRSVRADGTIKWIGSPVFVGEAFRGEKVGVEPVDEYISHVRLDSIVVGVLHLRSKTVGRVPPDTVPK